LNAAAVRRIGLSFGHLRTFNDGIGEVSLQLGRGLAEQALRLRAEHRVELHYHLPERLHGFFGADVLYRPTSDLQRLVHIGGPRFDLWHSLHQFNPFKPPLGTRAILQTILDLNFMHVGNARKRRKYLRRMRALAQRSVALTTISRFVCDDLRQHLGTQRPVHVIPLAARDLTGLSQEPVIPLPRPRFLLHVSRLAPSKNVVTLLELAACWSDMGIVLAGAASPYSHEIAEQVRVRSLDNVLVLEDISDAQKAWLFAHCEAFLFPSLTEGFGLPPLEAMHFGKPVFLSRLTSLPEIGGDVAHYFDSFEATAMRAVVEAGLATHRGPGHAEASIEWARSFSWSRCAEEYLDLYLRLIGLGQATRR
jgi:glycosyltransferase involved in cell wall biosynthesis